MNQTLFERGKDAILSGKALGGMLEGYPSIRIVGVDKDTILLALGMRDEQDDLLFEYDQIYRIPIGGSITLKSGNEATISFKVKIML